MAIRVLKPTSPGRRFLTLTTFDDITKSKPEKGLVVIKKSTGGRNNTGRTTARFRGGGHKRFYRIVDFKRDKVDITAKVSAIEYDPNRSCRIALITYPDGEKRYIIAPLLLKIGDSVMSSYKNALDVLSGNAMPLKFIPVGSTIHNVELNPFAGGKIIRSAGASGQLMAKEGGYALVKLPSGEIRKINEGCMASIGQVGNLDHENVSIGKAGRMRWLGRKPHNRGASMNPVDHPHGGGEGKAGQGNPHPVSPWGMLAKGYKTRRTKKYSDKFIVTRRK
ncbi:MAG TPA: 50S ribosomal protein L2 [bacterium]|uniref:Large ribosomal subunit protein uL2 n=1 Tax=uncultured bacterium Rifle_16ft_4_minimus_4564 TaxID=1665161 RepID=A0A0H4TTR1_9BACT|nr:ribosomal protein L2P [uncultured bacterium Rifle_16ft_4_minimus_4564]